MIKDAFLKGFNKMLDRNPEIVPTALGVGAGIGLGKLQSKSDAQKFYIEGSAKKKGLKPGTKKYKEYVDKQHKVRNIMTPTVYAADLGFMGFAYGRKKRMMNQAYEQARQYHQRYGKYQRAAGNSGLKSSELHSILGLSGKEKTKHEVHQAYKSMAKKHHPDAGGDAEKMKKVNNAMHDLKESEWFKKLACAISRTTNY